MTMNRNSVPCNPRVPRLNIGWHGIVILVLALCAGWLEIMSALPTQAAGDFGPDTCLQGWVWREAIPSDHVCVTPEIRAQTANDNSQASARRNSLNIWHTTYNPPNPCNGDTCQTTNSSPIYLLQGDHVNIGTLTIELRKTQNDALIATWTVNSTPLSSA